MLWYGLRGKFGKAFRRLKRNGSDAFIRGQKIHVTYPSVDDVRRSFAPAFRLEMWRGVGIVLPPSWMEPFFHRRPRLVEKLTRVDAWLGGLWMFRGLADHILYRFVRESE